MESKVITLAISSSLYDAGEYGSYLICFKMGQQVQSCLSGLYEINLGALFFLRDDLAVMLWRGVSNPRGVINSRFSPDVLVFRSAALRLSLDK